MFTPTPPSAKKARTRQQSIGEAFGIAATGSSVSQTVVDQRIMDLFVANMLPLHIVEFDTFERLIKTLNPSNSSISRRKLGRRIVSSYTDLKQYLIRLLDDVTWVATTADCWSAHNKAYLGMTVHWLDPTTRQRQRAVLACIRLKGHHTYEVLAQALVNIHYEFHIENKVTRTTTDNGSNFVKVFVQFGAKADMLPMLDIPVAQGVEAKSNEADADITVLLAESEDNQDLQLESVSLTDSLAVAEPDNDNIIDANLNQTFNLPVHMRCAAHTFNLVASKDADAALECAVFKRVYKAAMSKAVTLWNLQNRSTVAADSIYSEVGRRLVVPNTTRWNSTYDAVMVLNTILETKRPALHRIMTQLKLQTYNDQDINFMKEYAQVMLPVARALDKIQGEDQAYLGTLLLTIVATVFKLKDLKSKGLIYCSPLNDAVLGINKRFGPLLEDVECQLAASFHPRFRLIWLEKFDNTKVTKVRKNMEAKVEEAIMTMGRLSNEMSNNGRDNNNEEMVEDDFFSTITQPKESSRSHRSLKGKAQNLVKTWLETSSKDSLTDAAFLAEQVFVDLFIRFNTAIPSSAAVERLFSMGKDILKAKRSALSDENFHMLTFMKGNMHLMNKMQSEDRKEKN